MADFIACGHIACGHIACGVVTLRSRGFRRLEEEAGCGGVLGGGRSGVFGEFGG